MEEKDLPVCKPSDMIAIDEHYPYDGFSGDPNANVTLFDDKCIKECNYMEYFMDIATGDVDMAPLERYLEERSEKNPNMSFKYTNISP